MNDIMERMNSAMMIFNYAIKTFNCAIITKNSETGRINDAMRINNSEMIG